MTPADKPILKVYREEAKKRLPDGGLPPDEPQSIDNWRWVEAREATADRCDVTTRRVEEALGRVG